MSSTTTASFLRCSVRSPSHKLTWFVSILNQVNRENTCHGIILVICIYLRTCCDPPSLILQYFHHIYCCTFLNTSFCLHHYWNSFWAVSPISSEHFCLRPSLQVLSVLPGKKVITKWYKYILPSVPMDANKNIQQSQALPVRPYWNYTEIREPERTLRVSFQPALLCIPVSLVHP